MSRTNKSNPVPKRRAVMEYLQVRFTVKERQQILNAIGSKGGKDKPRFIDDCEHASSIFLSHHVPNNTDAQGELAGIYADGLVYETPHQHGENLKRLREAAEGYRDALLALGPVGRRSLQTNGAIGLNNDTVQDEDTGQSWGTFSVYREIERMELLIAATQNVTATIPQQTRPPHHALIELACYINEQFRKHGITATKAPNGALAKVLRTIRDAAQAKAPVGITISTIPDDPKNLLGYVRSEAADKPAEHRKGLLDLLPATPSKRKR